MEIISTHKRSPWRVCPLSCLAMDGTDNEIYKFVSARLTQFLPHGINATALPSSELIWNTCIYVMWHVSPTGGASWQMRRKNGCRPKKTIFFAPFAGPLGGDHQNMECNYPGQTSAHVQNFSQISSAVSEEMRPPNRQADRQLHEQQTWRKTR